MIKEKLKEIDAKVDAFIKEHPLAAFSICCGLIYTGMTVVNERAMEVAVRNGVVQALHCGTFRIKTLVS